MKNISVPFISNDGLTDGMPGESSLLDTVERQYIDTLLWSNEGYKPIVSFAIAYTEDSILLKYFVAEKYVKADYCIINDPVYKDSCVEFFIAFGDEKGYYNLEFNPIGTALIGYGTDKNDRKLLNKTLISQVEKHHTITQPFQGNSITEWELTLKIPFALFIHHAVTSLADQVCRANFYKCGDDLPVPHFLSWSPVDNPEPNFHLPQFFGTLFFA
jgi:hypothetical protein